MILAVEVNVGPGLPLGVIPIDSVNGMDVGSHGLPPVLGRNSSSWVRSTLE